MQPLSPPRVTFMDHNGSTSEDCSTTVAVFSTSSRRQTAGGRCIPLWIQSVLSSEAKALRYPQSASPLMPAACSLRRRQEGQGGQEAGAQGAARCAPPGSRGASAAADARGDGGRQRASRGHPTHLGADFLLVSLSHPSFQLLLLCALTVIARPRRHPTHLGCTDCPIHLPCEPRMTDA